MEIQCLSTYLALDCRHAPAVGRVLPDRAGEIFSNLLQEQAAQIIEGALRHSFLDHMPKHRTIVAAHRAVHTTGDPAEEKG